MNDLERDFDGEAPYDAGDDAGDDAAYEDMPGLINYEDDDMPGLDGLDNMYCYNDRSFIMNRYEDFNRFNNYDYDCEEIKAELEYEEFKSEVESVLKTDLDSEVECELKTEESKTKTEELKTEELKTEESKTEESKTEESKTEESKTEESKTEVESELKTESESKEIEPTKQEPAINREINEQKQTKQTCIII